jgi:hypothetical protein
MSHVCSSAREYEGINPHAPKGTPILGVGVLVDSQMSKEQLHGSKPNGLRSSLYHWKGIESKMSKWARMTHWTFETQVMVKRKAGNQIGSLTLDH